MKYYIITVEGGANIEVSDPYLLQYKREQDIISQCKNDDDIKNGMVSVFRADVDKDGNLFVRNVLNSEVEED